MKNQRRARALLRLSPKEHIRLPSQPLGRAEADGSAPVHPGQRGRPAGENRERQQPNPREPTARTTAMRLSFKQSIGRSQDPDHTPFA